MADLPKPSTPKPAKAPKSLRRMSERELNASDPFDADFVDPEEARAERKEKKRKKRSPVAMAVAMLST